MGVLVCCVDDSEGARAALRVSRELAEKLDHELMLLHVEPATEAPGVSAVPAGQERLREAELRDAEELLARLASETGLEPDTARRTEIGHAADRIVAVCEEVSPAFVVIGSRGRSGIRAALLGSVSSKVAARAPCPCVIVPPTAAGRPSPA
jgi:nucleotide-binding universal stress UspA family protein